MPTTNRSSYVRYLGWGLVGPAVVASIFSGKGALADEAPASGASPPASSASPPASSAPAPRPAPPPYMYQEPWEPPQEPWAPPSEPGPPGEPRPPRPGYRRGPSYPPPPYPPPPPGAYVYEPPPPMAAMHRSPYNALWLGARIGALFPVGRAYDYGYDYYSGYDYGEQWSGLATGGLLLEADAGVRFARHFIVYGFWEHARLGVGNDPSWRTGTRAGLPPFGDQDSASTDFPGVGFRWSANPDRIGVVVDAGLGYRWFHEKWTSGAKMDLEGFGEFRLGIGADVRVNRVFSLSPMFMFSSGTFNDRTLTVPGQPSAAIPSYAGNHGTVTLTVGGHFDFGS